MVLTTWRIHYFCVMVAFLQSLALTVGCRAVSEEGFDLVAFSRAWKEYVSYPSGENARRLTDLLPDTGRYTEFLSPDQYDEMSSVAWEVGQTLGMLEYQVCAGDREAVRLAFRLLYTYADGHVAEEICIMLGVLIRSNPQLFLEELHNHPPQWVSLGHLVGDFGPNFVDLDSAEWLEATLRIKALQTVSDSQLVEVRDQCIEFLEEYARMLKED